MEFTAVVRPGPLIFVAFLSLSAPAGAEGLEEGNRLVFILPSDVSAELEASLRDAIEAQFAGMQAHVNFRRFDRPMPTLRDQVAAAREIAAEDESMGVFWVEVAESDDWLLYLSPPSGDRVLVRRLAKTSNVAAVETVSVITRESASALLSGSTIGMETVAVGEPAPAAAPPSPPARPDRGAPIDSPVPEPPPTTPAPPTVAWGLRVGAGYRGNTYSTDVAWQHGASVNVQWFTELGPFAGLGLAVFPEIEVRDVATTFHIGRTPLGAWAGWRLRAERFSVDLSAAYTLELLQRRAFATLPGARSPADDVRTVSLLGVRASLEYTMTAVLGLYVQTGMDLALNNFEFVARQGADQRTLLEPDQVRALVEVGVSVWP